MNDTEKLPIDAYVIGFDETEYYNIEEEDKPHIEKIMGVYLFDRNEATHCCELTPSYSLIHLYDTVVLKGYDIDDDHEGLIYEQYEHCGNDDMYVHCSDIDKMIKSGKDVYHGGASSDQEATYEEQMEGLREYYCGNHVV